MNVVKLLSDCVINQIYITSLSRSRAAIEENIIEKMKEVVGNIDFFEIMVFAAVITYYS